jgi:methionyl-tRNA synthetase
MSKSVGNVIDPGQLLPAWTVEEVRGYLIYNGPSKGTDVEFSEDGMAAFVHTLNN